MIAIFIFLFIVFGIVGYILESKASKYYTGLPRHRWMHVYVFFPENFTQEGKIYHKYLVIYAIVAILLFIGWVVYVSIKNGT
jgi:hypothetical protein